MAIAEQQLAQAQGTGLTASVFSPASGQTVLIREIRIVNTTAGSLNFDLYHDDNGTTYDATTAIYPTTTLVANAMLVDKTHIYMNDSTGNIGFNAPAGLTITLYGAVFT